jgi:uncharacterized delta-60 repeat protein
MNQLHLAHKMTTMKLRSYLILALVLISGQLFAQPGANDPTFNPGDIGFGNGDGANGIVETTSIQADGKIVIGGAFTSYNGVARNRIARLNADGSLDASFNPGTGANDIVRTTAIQSDGKIIIGGFFTSYNGVARNRIARLNTDGTLDASFNPGTGANAAVLSSSIQTDGKIIIGGFFTSYNGVTRNFIARLNTDGTLDASFNPGIGANEWVYATSIQADGKIIIGGGFTSYNGVARNRIARLNADGSLDASFNPGTGANGMVWTTSIQSDGKIIIGGNFTSYNGVARNRIARLNADGSLDASFNPGTGANSAVWTTAIQADGKIIIGGDFTSYNGVVRNRIARLNTDGSLDPSFNPGTGANNGISTTSIQADGKIITGGLFTSYNGVTRNFIARLNTDGTLDASFNPGTGFNNYVLTTSIQTDGKIIIGGEFTSYNGVTRNHIARLNTDGSLDAAFDPGTGANSAVWTTAIQADGKIIIGGDFTSYNGVVRNRIARINTDGSLDVSFNTGTGAYGVVENTSIQADGKIIIGGGFTSYNGVARNYIARLNADGSLDASFNPGTGANGMVYTTSIQTDGKIIIGGGFTSYNGVARNYIARLNVDGSLDASFNPGTGANFDVLTTSIQADGKIIIGGAFNSYNGVERSRIARLNTDGTLDASFDPGTGADVDVNTTSIQADGKVIIGGGFTSYNGVARSRIARLNADGTLDASFDPGTGANFAVRTTSIQADGKIIIGGEFTSYSGFGRNRIARILNPFPPTISSFTPVSGCTGATSVEIYGTHFTDASAVSIGGVPVSSFTVLSSTQISVSIGNAITGVVAVTTPGGTITSGAVFTVFQLPAVNAGADQTVCEGTPITLSASGAVNYSWDNAAQDGVSFIPTGTQVYTVTGTDANNCSNTDQVTVTVNTLPTINAGADQTVCDGDPVTLTASGGTSYAWNNSIQDGVSFTPSVGSTTYTVTGTDANNCSNTDQVTVTVNTLPAINAGSDQTVCDGDPVTLTASGGTSYTWSNSILDGVSFTPSVGSTTYTVTGTDANNCSNTDDVIVTVNEHTTATQTQSALDSYTWPVNGQTYSSSGTYTATIPNASGCDSTITLNLTLNFTGISEMEVSSVSVYPNPSIDHITVEVESVLTGKGYTLYDVMGKKILSGVLTSEKNHVSTSGLSTGIYTFKIEGAEGQSIRIVKNE